MVRERMRRLRKQYGYTQTMLAETLGLSKGTVAMWETEKRIPEVETLHKIAQLFNVNMEYLMGYTDIEEPLPDVSNQQEQEEQLSDVPEQHEEHKELNLKITVTIEGVKVYEN